MSELTTFVLGIALFLLGMFVPMRYPNTPEWVSDGGILLGIALVAVAGGLFVSGLPLAEKISRLGGPKILIATGVTIFVLGAVLYFKSPKGENTPLVALRLVHPKIPSLQLINASTHTARDIKWTVVLWNKRLLPGRIDPLPIPVQTFDWIKGGQNGGPQALFLDQRVRALVNDGDELIGSASVNCPDCVRAKTYAVFIKFGHGGWYSEIKNETKGDVLVPQKMNEESIRGYFDAIIGMAPQDSRTEIAED